MTRKSQLLTAYAAIAALSGATFGAIAQGFPDVDAKGGGAVDIKSIDTNGDGKVSKSEASANQDLQAQFSSLDANKDGTLDTGEFARFEAKGGAKGDAGMKEKTDQPKK